MRSCKYLHNSTQRSGMSLYSYNIKAIAKCTAIYPAAPILIQDEASFKKMLKMRERPEFGELHYERCSKIKFNNVIINSLQIITKFLNLTVQ